MHPEATHLAAQSRCVRTYSSSLWVLLRASSMELFTRGSNMPDNKHTKGVVDKVNIRLTHASLNEPQLLQRKGMKLLHDGKMNEIWEQ